MTQGMLTSNMLWTKTLLSVVVWKWYRKPLSKQTPRKVKALFVDMRFLIPELMPVHLRYDSRTVEWGFSVIYGRWNVIPLQR